MLKNLPTPRLILLRIRVGNVCSLGVGSFNNSINSFNTSPSLFSQQLSAGKHALLLKDASRKGRWRRQRAAEIVLENDAEGRRMFENVLKGDPDCGAGSSLEPDLSKKVSENGCSCSVFFLGQRARRRLLEARTERAEVGSDHASFESLFVRRECPDDHVRASFGLNLRHPHSARSACNSLARPMHDARNSQNSQARNSQNSLARSLHVVHAARCVQNSSNSVGVYEDGVSAYLGEQSC